MIMSIVRVAIVGSGYSGAAAFHFLEKCLGKTRQAIDLVYVSQDSYYCLENYATELLTNSSDLTEVCHGIRNIGMLRPGVSFLQSTVLELDLNSKVIKTSSGEILYDYLILAPVKDIDLPDKEIKVSTFFKLQTPYEIMLFKNQVLNTFQAAVVEKNIDLKKELMTFTVMGDGCKAIELACSIYDYASRLLRKSFPELNGCMLKVNMILKGEQIVDDEKLFFSSRLLYHLKKRGINVYLNSKSLKQHDGLIDINGEDSIVHGTIVREHSRCSSLVQNQPFRKDEYENISVDLYLKADGFDDIFVIGESSKCLDVNDSEVRTNYFYKTQAKICADNILALLNNNPLKPLKVNSYINFISLGYRNSILIIKEFYFDGLLSWMICRLVSLWSFLGWKKKLRSVFAFFVNIFGLRDNEVVLISDLSRKIEKVRK